MLATRGIKNPHETIMISRLFEYTIETDLHQPQILITMQKLINT